MFRLASLSIISLFIVFQSKSSFSMQEYWGKPKAISAWNISCSMDDDSITRKGNNWIFKTSKNRCEGGTFKQRAELSSPKALKLTTKAKYEFQSIFRMKSKESSGLSNLEEFEIFQIHDGRLGCAPPLSVGFLKTGKVRLLGDYKIGTADGQNCDKKIMFDVGDTVVKRDGTEYKLNVVLEFNGNSSFKVAVYINDRLEALGKYSPPIEKGYFKSKYYYFKHGVYSQNMFDYELNSKIQMRLVD